MRARDLDPDSAVEHQNAVNLLLKLLATIFLLLLGYECMAFVLHLLNRPRDSAVYEGTACLVVLFLFLPIEL